MARFRRRAGAAVAASGETQLGLFERIEVATQPRVADATIEARRLFYAVLALMALGFLLQASHAATTLPEDLFQQHLAKLAGMRGVAILIVVGLWQLGTERLKPLAPALAIVALLLLVAVFVPGLQARINGARRWVDLPLLPFNLQASDVARVLGIVWLARRCEDLGPRVEEGLHGYLPTLGMGLVFALLIFLEPDLGSTVLLGVTWGSVMWVAGFQQRHIATSAAALGSAALVAGATMFSHVRDRLAIFMGEATNDQVSGSARAFSSGGFWGVGLGQGQARLAGLQYQQTDFVFALVGEELGLFGALLVVGAYMVVLWSGLRIARSVESPFAALVAFGLTVGVCLQALVHISVVTRLAPPKGMTLPFISDGNTSLLASSLAVGLILGATRRSPLPKEI
ncbi:MAG: FtsW/RodA/SpoVE family cell cycle protein [Planctomycetota bacterium]|nr:FtsW/RodA/SpoVE family cell cycle protein [Planctomycetota bacterium]